MSDETLVLDTIAEGLAELEALVPAPVGELGYGVDLSCTTDVTPDFDEVDPNSYQGIGEAQFRRLITRRGLLVDDPDFGRDVRGLVNRGVTTRDLLDEAGQIKLECEKDDRIRRADVTLTPEQGGKRIRITIRNTPEDPRLAVFTLIMAVTSGQAMLEAINAVS
jgi:hypothetical protein